MNTYKIIFAGPVGAGKTTAIRALSDIEPFTTEELATDDVRNIKTHTTVAMDYGLMMLGNGEHIHLYGTPGQKRFDFMWEILTEGGIGLILLLNHQAQAPLDELAYYIDQFAAFIDSTALAVGVTRRTPGQGPGLDDYATFLAGHRILAPVFDVDARQSNDVAVLAQALLYTLDPTLPQDTRCE